MGTPNILLIYYVDFALSFTWLSFVKFGGASKGGILVILKKKTTVLFLFSAVIRYLFTLFSFHFIRYLKFSSSILIVCCLSTTLES